ncbi:signal transduction response regulator [Thiolapillus brandeum]|uniref:Signal transduction response regulator n=1 Tax=Thiolapillus brandeum TaxID=1076588 RepID=A0A7U6GHB3_9GAMM|nr:signal transduction response regulator [Thiolapillus brandeum]
MELLVLGCSIDDANIYSQTLRNSGMAVHLNTAYTPDELDTLVQTLDADVVLVNTDAEEIDFTTAIRQIREVSPLAAFILLSDDPDEELFFAAETRAQDIIERNDHAHLIYVVNREQQNMITKKKLLAVTQELKETKQRYETLTETARDAIAYIHQGMHVYANPAYVSLFGFNNPDELEGLPFMDLIASDDRLKFKPVLHKLDEEHTAEQIDITCVTNEGKDLSVTMDFAPSTIDGEDCTQVIIRSQASDMDIEQRLAELANYDTDTGLHNRKYFNENLELQFAEARDTNQRLSMILLNIVNFPDIKTDFNLDAGETVLKEVTHILNETTYDTDLVSRFGEHEFAILCTPGTDAESLANRLAKALNDHSFEEDGTSISPQFVFGISHSDAPPAKSATDLISHAVKARKQGLANNTAIVSFEKGGQQAAEQNNGNESVVQLIDQALSNDQFHLVYQPVVSLHGNSREDYAIYVRMLNEEGQQISPEEFMEDAIRSERMAEIDRWVIRNAIREVASHRADGHKLNFLITLSAAGIEDDSLLLWICDCLREFKAKGAWLAFAVAHNDVIAHLEKMEQLAEGLRKINCRITLTHFPFEQEAVNVVRHLNSDMVCFTPEISGKLSQDKEQQELLKDYNEQLHKEKVKTIVTHIEEAAQLTLLWNVGVDFIQGNFIQKPVDTIIYDAEL